MNPRDLSKKIILGTVQLGLPYGINNDSGKPNQEEAGRILEGAISYGIDLLDSAEAYGNSIEVIGSFHKANKSRRFRVISKFIYDPKPLKVKLQESLDTLSIEKLYAYMYHRYDDYALQRNRSELASLKKDLKIERIGVSVYSLEELKKVIEDELISVIQIPYNPFDAGPQKRDLLRMAKANGKEIHARSVFLQGLFFKKPEQLTGNLRELEEPLRVFHQTITKYHLGVKEACLNFALYENSIDNVLIGVETHHQLEQNMDSILPSFSEEIKEILHKLPVKNASLLNPSNWRL